MSVCLEDYTNMTDESFITIYTIVAASIAYETVREREAKIVVNLGLLKAMSEAIISKTPGYITACLRFARELTGQRIPISVIVQVHRDKVWLGFEPEHGWYATEEKLLYAR